jgi:hypothetical protein
MNHQPNPIDTSGVALCPEIIESPKSLRKMFAGFEQAGETGGDGCMK